MIANLIKVHSCPDRNLADHLIQGIRVSFPRNLSSRKRGTGIQACPCENREPLEKPGFPASSAGQE